MNASELNAPLAEYDFERIFDERRALEWMQENWSKAFMFCGLYAVLVFGGQHFMRERPKLNLRRPLVLIIGALRTGLYMLHVLTAHGFRQSVCDISFYSAPVSKFWAYAFQRLIFLHWYHHITVLLYSWYSYKDQVAGGGWFMTMNYVVHSLMYTYYAARAAGLRVPRPCAMVITATQILQMVMGLAVLGLVYHWMHDVHCPSNVDNVAWGFLMYLSYLVLFALFFYDTYLRGSSGDKGSKA
ncbi:hypothetical protein FQN60_002846, partial [Etheostoma spectabile]